MCFVRHATNDRPQVGHGAAVRRDASGAQRARYSAIAEPEVEVHPLLRRSPVQR